MTRPQRSTGLLWQPMAPNNWALKPLCRVASVNDDVLPSRFPIDAEISYVDISSVTYGKGIESSETMVFANAPSRARRLAKKGDVVVSTVRTYLKALAEVDNDHAHCVFSTGFAVLRRKPDQLKEGFLKWITSNDLLVQAIESHSTGVSYPAINAGDLVKLKVTVPPPDEQQRIAATLDRETARIDALIEKKTRFIELLKEKRQALLHDCLMHPDTIRMRLERCTESPTRPIDRDDEVSYTRLGLYNRGRGIFHKPEAIGRELGDSSFTWVHEGDLIVSGQFAWEGAVSLASNDEHGCVISHRYHTYRGKHDVTDTAYLWAYFTSHEGDFVLNDHSRGSAGRNRPLNPNTLAKEKIPVPPMVMQKRVAALVEFENRFKALVARSTALLNERRSALITGAVTGQLDLREDAA